MLAINVVRNNSGQPERLEILNPTPGVKEDFLNAMRKINPPRFDFGYFTDLDGNKIYGFKDFASFPSYKPYEYDEMSNTKDPVCFYAENGDRHIIYDDMFRKDDRSLIARLLKPFM